MKKLHVTLFMLLATTVIAFAQTGELKVGERAPEWVFPNADGKEYTMEHWPNMVLQINYVDPDHSDMNDAANDAVSKAVDAGKIIDDEFAGFGILDCKSTWKPNSLIRLIAGNKAKKYGTTILFDYDATLQKSWNLPKDSYSIVIIDKNRICRAIYKGEVKPEQYDKLIKLISDIQKEK